jgi:hypothetical protein
VTTHISLKPQYIFYAFTLKQKKRRVKIIKKNFKSSKQKVLINKLSILKQKIKQQMKSKKKLAKK